ncbi:aldehyde dehydrogenase family protein [Nocardiopsis sp. NRRL B-16309]|uniref:L-piperidine-6-carboxylate dehydrogenase n=1 Tax=Nocardiopsis sp. NRRL B-16309 TaxID=1519494 RepID=UPI0006ADDACE|nr:aldehyde dehydrogenase family protein [Nocardiopsis sp. NRRL B-16309]KOX15477.1 aldehyde dehydrogenase [Nocardiopsis sp. NRRL B-16309]
MDTAALPDTRDLAERARAALARCGVERLREPVGAAGVARTPLTGQILFPVEFDTPASAERAVTAARDTFTTAWRDTPAPVRGRLVHRLGELLREHKEDLAALVTVEAGKIHSEALGEVQEMIDICDLAVGLSRQLYGRTMPSERPGHRLMETWHPLGVVGVITAFNFPVAVWSWNTCVALVCGNTVVWKPSDSTPLTALACHGLLTRAAADVGAPAGVHHVVLGGREVGEALVEDERVALLSATGSVAMGRTVAPRVAARMGRCLLELGGNNAAVVGPSADLDLVVRGSVFSAAGTAGQRCTTLRRLIVHEDVAEEVTNRIVDAYKQLRDRVGDPFDEETLVGPLVSERGYAGMREALSRAEADGGEVLVGGARRLAEAAEDAYYVEPAVVRMPAQSEIVREETFAPILYVLTYRTFEEAVELHNGVPQGLSSSIFTQDQSEAERFLSAAGSDCGIVNVNIGTSGAEIGGAFGGEKDTGGGRESGSDSWKAYMRRATNTVNYGGELPLAQGVRFL